MLPSVNTSTEYMYSFSPLQLLRSALLQLIGLRPLKWKVLCRTYRNLGVVSGEIAPSFRPQG
jgi:hypothetical protein